MKIKLVVYTHGGVPLTKLSEKQKERFIGMLKKSNYNEDVKLGIELALTAMGYVIKEIQD